MMSGRIDFPFSRIVRLWYNLTMGVVPVTKCKPSDVIYRATRVPHLSKFFGNTFTRLSRRALSEKRLLFIGRIYFRIRCSGIPSYIIIRTLTSVASQ